MQSVPVMPKKFYYFLRKLGPVWFLFFKTVFENSFVNIKNTKGLVGSCFLKLFMFSKFSVFYVVCVFQNKKKLGTKHFSSFSLVLITENSFHK